MSARYYLKSVGTVDRPLTELVDSETGRVVERSRSDDPVWLQDLCYFLNSENEEQKREQQ